MISARGVARAAVALLVMAVFCGLENEAAGEQIVLTLEAYAPSTLPKVSTSIDVPHINDQLDISRRGCLFAISPDGWNLGSFGGFLIQRDPPLWSNSICRVAIQGQRNLALEQVLGYSLNAEAIQYGPDYDLWFHTDAWCERPEHNCGESANNYGVISGCMGGFWEQCAAQDWGRFTVTPEPATLSLLAVGGLVALRRRR